MSRRAGAIVGQAITANFNGAGTIYSIRTVGGVNYQVFLNDQSDVVFRKSTNNGIGWSDQTSVFAGTCTALSVWYDRWSGISGGLIHIAWQESVTDDTLYRTINTESADALSTQTVIFAGATTAAGGHLSITRARGGNVYCKTCIDAGAEGGFFRLPNANVPSGAWDAARTINEALATQDQMILLPGFAADNQDLIGIFWDASANEVSRQIYDDSANSWAETSIATSMTDLVATTAFPNFAASVDLTNSRIVLVAWTVADTLNADLLCWTVTESAITATADVVTNSTDDQGLCAIAIDSDNADRWWVFYGGKTDGSETFQSNIGIYMKGTADAGSTWSPEVMASVETNNVRQLYTTPRCVDGRWGLVFYNDVNRDELVFIAPLVQPRTTYQLGV